LIIGGAAAALLLGAVSVSAAQGTRADDMPSQNEIDQRILKLKNLGAEEIDWALLGPRVDPAPSPGGFT